MDNTGWCANASKDGLIWISTQESHLYRVDIFTNYFPRFETGVGSTNAFYQEEPGVLWLGTYNGLIRKNTRDGTSRRFTNESTDPGNTGINSINGIIKDKQGDFLISSYGGISRFNPNTGLFTRFEVDSSIKFSIRSNVGCLLYMDSRSNLWFGTNDALHFLDRETGKYIHYNHVLNDSNSLSSAPVVFMMEEENGLWVGTYYAGLSRLNRQTGKFRHYLSVAFTTCIYRDLKGIIWVGTGNGLYRYNQQSDSFSVFDEGYAGIKIDNVSSLIGDDQDNLWVASASGIYRINQTRDQIILYDKKNGVDRFASQLYWGVSSYKGLDAEIFFSSSSGYYAFYPDKLKIPPAGVQTIELSKFWLKGLDVKVNPDGPLTKPLSGTKEIRLKHDQNVFSLSFTATDYGNPEDKTFYYKLENYDEDWRLSGADEKAYYFNVPPGKYVFRIKVSNNTNGATAEKGISIIISPPWWQTWWAYLLYALVIVIAVILIDRVQKKKVIRKARELGRERELEMQALRAQMNPHFIFNCLSSINNFVLKNETEEASDYLTKFSRLIRTVLNNSKKSYIPLEDELDMLRLYLEMETLRFKGGFKYYIHKEEKIDSSAIFIPPLLIQPFVENAIWHGLLHKAAPGRLDISVKVEKNILICIIEDNGVGRSFARVSESKSVEKKKSLGIQITRERLSLINGNAEIAGNDFVIEDLYNDIGHATGTKVILRLMYKEINDEFI
jgi:streptogramin lyase